MAPSPKDPEEVFALLPTGSEESKVEVVQPQPQLKRRAGAVLVGLALLGAALYATSHGSSQQYLDKAEVENGVQLNAEASKDKARGPVTPTFIIKHTFKDKDDVNPWWDKSQKLMADQEALKKWTRAVMKEGFHNSFFLPTAAGGPFICIWVAKPGTSKKDMEEFINSNDLSPAKNMHNDVMPVDMKLAGPPDTSIYHGPTSTSSWYIIQHEFRADDDIKPFWKHMGIVMQPKNFKKWTDGVAKEGFHNAFFLPTSLKGPFFCMWEAEAGKTQEDMEKFINENELSPVGNMDNKVMSIPMKLLGGQPPVVPLFPIKKSK